MNNFRGDLTDVSMETNTLVFTLFTLYRIVKIVALFPFFETTKANPKQRVLRQVCQYPGVLAAVAHVLEHMPDRHVF